MKHCMTPRNTILREIDASPLSNSSPSKPRSSRKQKSSKENFPPLDRYFPSPATAAAKLKSPLPPRPPSSSPLKRRLRMENVNDGSVPGTSDSGVQVVVRMRPPCRDKDEGDVIVQKISSESLSINGQTFTFDSVADTEATQLDLFQLVGKPLVENCMAGFNSSVFAYGQTASGKTYTMWGPANALLDENLSSDQHGLTPRVFEHLFSRINEEQMKHADKQLKYQCNCSLLEIYNEQITDLLDPNHRHLQIREDVKSGIYVENLTEQRVCTMADVNQLLIKGMSNRRTDSTSINSESSRSHTVFTCVIESRCKSTDGMSTFKTSRINLVDLSGSERQKLTGAAGERLKEAGNINRSLSQLGNLINILAEISQTGKQRHIPYRDSRLTFLLQESLGGNAKLAMVCAISPTQSCKSETFSTLRFAQRAKGIKNKAIVNEVMHDDVNHLREVIQQLRDELRRVKANDMHPVDSNEGHSAAWIRRSLNLIKASLNCPISLCGVDEDGDEVMEIDQEAVEKLCIQVGEQSESNEAPVRKVEVGVQTRHEMQQEPPAKEFICSSCKSRRQIEVNEASDSSNLQLVPVDASEYADKLKKQVPKAVEKVLAGAIRREMELEDLCAKQTSEIAQLKRLVQQYKDERECDSIIAQTREDKIVLLHGLIDGILPTEDFMEESRIEHEALRSVAEKRERELESEKKCEEEVMEAMQLAMEGYARMLEQYADLEERHMALLGRHRRILEGIEDVKKAAAKTGVRESKFIKALSAALYSHVKHTLYYHKQNR